MRRTTHFPYLIRLCNNANIDRSRSLVTLRADDFIRYHEITENVIAALHFFLDIALHSPSRRSKPRLQEASLLQGPFSLKSIRGFSSDRSRLWLATVPLALFGLGIFNLRSCSRDA